MVTTEEAEVKTGDVRIRVIADSDPQHPRRDWDCQLDTMLCWHRSYDLGDENPHKDGNSVDMFLDILRDASPEILRPVVLMLIRHSKDIRRDYINWCYNISNYSKADRHDNWIDFLEGQLEGTSYEKFNEELLDAARKVAGIMPLYLYDHSGITMNTGGFHCPWDSGQVGWIYMSFKKFIEESGHASWVEKVRGKLGRRNLKKLEEWLVNSVEVFDQFIRGDIYGFIMETAEVCNVGHVHWEDADSCWGFYGTEMDNGMADHIPEEHHDKLREALNNPEYS